MSDIHKKYQDLSKEIDAFNNEIIVLSRDNIVVKNLYKGCQVLYSHVMERPKIFLMGINPGSG